MKRICKQCGEANFKILANKICQKCLSNNREKALLSRGNDLIISSDELIMEYIQNGKSVRKIALERGITDSKVKKLLLNYLIPIKPPKKRINENLFGKNLSARAAYVLGYIFTDGDLVFNTKSNRYFLRIYSKDEKQVQKIKEILESDSKIQKRNSSSYGGVNQSEIFFLHVGNQVIINDLINLGLTEKKNENINFPNISNNLMRHFIRGCWAGSGNVTVYKGGVFSSLTIGSIKFIEKIESILNEKGLKKRKIYRNKQSQNSSYLIKYANAESEKLYNYLYKGSNELVVSDKQYIIYKTHFK